MTHPERAPEEEILEQLEAGSKPPVLPEGELQLTPEQVERVANYNGDWGMLLLTRLRNPETRKKYIETKKEHEGEVVLSRTGGEQKMEEVEAETDLIDSGELSLTKTPKTITVEEIIENYDQNLENVFKSTIYGPALETGQSTTALGMSKGYGSTGAVFEDARTRDGEPLTGRQNNIIEAHEKAHGLLDGLTGGEKAEITGALDSAIEGYGGRNQAVEIVARMSQLKNYFGFTGEEEFTKTHLDYAREHYANDTGLDNNMTEFFEAITPDSEERFLKLINKYAC